MFYILDLTDNLGTLTRFSAIVYKADNVNSPIHKDLGVYSERKAFASKASKLFHFRVDPFQKGAKFYGVGP